MTQFAFVSGKGGVGQSFLVANLARVLVASGSPVEVVRIADSPPGVEILVPGDEPEGLKVSQVSSLESLSESSDEGSMRLLDLPAGLAAPDLEALAKSDLVVLVVNPEPASLVGSYRLLQRLVKANRAVLTGLIVNKADPAQADAVAKRLKSFSGRHLGCPIRFLGSVCESGAVTRAMRTRRLLATAAPRSKALGELRDIAESLKTWTRPEGSRPLLESLKPLEGVATPMAA